MSTETEYASVEDLVSTGLQADTRDVTLPSGKKVKVRGLNRFELMLSTKGSPENDVYERRLLSMGIVEPRMTEKQIEGWQKAILAGDSVMADVVTAVRELSGLTEGADKSDDEGVSD